MNPLAIAPSNVDSIFVRVGVSIFPGVNKPEGVFTRNEIQPDILTNNFDSLFSPFMQLNR